MVRSDPEFGKLLARARISKKLTQAQVAKLARVSRGTIVEAEHGRIPRKVTLQKLLVPLGLTVEDLPSRHRS